MNRTLIFDFIQPIEIVQWEAFDPCNFNTQCFSLLYALDGSGIVKSGKRDLNISEGELLLLPPGQYNIDGCFRLVRISFSAACTSLQSLTKRLFFATALSEREANEHVMSILATQDNAEPFAADRIALEIQYLILILAQELITDPDPESSVGARDIEILEQIKCYIQEHLSEEISLQDLVSCSLCSSKRIYALFKKYYNSTPIKYLSNYRMETAKHMLMTSSMTVTEIAAACGFKTIHYFSREFKIYTGLSPNAFRRLSSERNYPAGSSNKA